MRWGRRLATSVLALGAVGVGLLLAGCGSSSSGKTLTLGYVTTPTHPYGIALQDFANNVDKLSGGTLKIKLLPDYGGGNDATLLADERGGSVNMGSVSASIWDTVGVKSFQALQMPFLITNYKLEKAVLDSPIQQQMLAGTAAVGLHGLAIHEGGLRKPLSTGSCILTVQNFAGKKMRVPPSALLTDSIKALGAVPVPLALSDVYLGLKQGTVSSMEANYGLIYTQKFYEVSKCVTGNVNLWPFPSVLSINNTAWSGLTSQQQAWITSAASKVPDDSISIVSSTVKPTLVDKLCATGLKIGTATQADLAAMRNQVNPIYTQYASTGVTANFVKQIEKIRAGVTPPAPTPLPAGCAGS